VEFVDGEFAGEHHGDFGEFDGEGVDVHAEELAGVDVVEGGLAWGNSARRRSRMRASSRLRMR